MGILLTTAGCTRTVHGGFDDSPDRRYRLYGRVYGAYGKRFLANTSKTVRVNIVSIEHDEKLLFSKEYRFHGFDISWDSKWEGDNYLTVTISDRQPSTGANRSQGPGPQPKYLRVFHYRYDLTTGMFIEVSPP